MHVLLLWQFFIQWMVGDYFLRSDIILGGQEVARMVKIAQISYGTTLLGAAGRKKY